MSIDKYTFFLHRLDFDNCARKIAAKKFAADNNSMLKDNYDAESE